LASRARRSSAGRARLAAALSVRLRRVGLRAAAVLRRVCLVATLAVVTRLRTSIGITSRLSGPVGIQARRGAVDIVMTRRVALTVS
jgi:hypothetical protein